MQSQDDGVMAPATIDISQQMNTDPNFAPSQTMATPTDTIQMATAPMVQTPMAVVAANPGNSGSMVNFASAMSVFKYGFISVLGWIVSLIVLGVVWGFSLVVALQLENTVVKIIIVLVTLLVTLIGYGQMIIYPVGKALKDARGDTSAFSYVDSWKASISSFIETIVVTAGMAVLLAVGLSEDIGALTALAGLGFMLFLIGYIPYLARKTAQFIN